MSGSSPTGCRAWEHPLRWQIEPIGDWMLLLLNGCKEQQMLLLQSNFKYIGAIEMGS